MFIDEFSIDLNIIEFNDVKDMDFETNFKDENIAKIFADFHKDHSKLQILTKDEHKSKHMRRFKNA